MITRRQAAILIIACIGCIVVGCGDDDNGTSPEVNPPARIYWVERPGDCSSSAIWRMDLDGSAPAPVISLPGPDSMADIAVDAAGGKVYFTFGQSSANSTETVQRVNIDGSGLDTIATYTSPDDLTPRGLVLDTAAGQVYWLATGGCSECPACGLCSRIHRADLSGANPTPIEVLTGFHNPSSLTFDPEARILYWSDIQNAPHISSIAIPGTDIDPVYTKPLGSSGGVGDVEIDLTNSKLYWLESEDIGDSCAIRQVGLGVGSSVENVLKAGGSQATTPRGLAVDAVEGKVYWTESGFCGDPTSGRIRRANLDGSGTETVIDSLGILVAIELVR